MHPIIGRIEQTVITIWAAITIGFVLIHQLPSSGVQMLIAIYGRDRFSEMSTEKIKQLSEGLIGFNPTDPLYQQYLQYVGNLLQGNFGVSALYGEPVFEVLASAIPWTLFMATLAMIFNTTLAVSLGAYMAYRQGSAFDIGGTVVSIVVSSIPYYVFAILLLFLLGFQMGWFPTSGRFGDSVTPGFNLPFMISALRHVTLPFISLTFTSFAALGLRAHSIRILGSDYIRVARLRGLSERRIVYHYVLRNSLLPFYTGFVTGLVGLLGGSVITEQIFNYIGVGYFMFKAATAGDIPMVLGTFAFFTIASVLALFVVDMTYHLVDPRAEGVGTDESF